MIRLKDIAESAGVSVMTVSKALRNEPDISDATKARIRAIADRTGYVPNNSARGLRTRRTQQFGLIISALSNPMYTRTFMAYSFDQSIGRILPPAFTRNSNAGRRPP